MDRHYAVNCIVEGADLYFRKFALADGMHHHQGEIEWISPLPKAGGPSLVFKVSLDDETALDRIDEITTGIEAGQIPSLWVISPTCTPANIGEVLLRRGFKDLTNPVSPELGMALDTEMIPMQSRSNPGLTVIKAQSPSEFALWIEVVNQALHGWEMLSTERYYPWMTDDAMSFYLAFLDRSPVATVATIQDGDKASVEFVGTLMKYRNQGVATTLCMKALLDLRKNDARIVTLRSSNDAIPLYASLGFEPYYDQVIMAYQTG